MRKYLAEFIGTFFLVLAIGMALLNPGAGDLAPIAIGSALMVMVYACGHVSGAHFNPAVTLAMWLRGRCPQSDLPGYIVAQIFGAGAAAMLALFLKDDPFVPPQTIDHLGAALIAEFVGTFALVYVILNVATAKETAGNSHYGLAIGFTVTAMAFAFGGISGGVFNPAVAIGAIIMHLVKAGNIWIYLVANLAAGVAAAKTFTWMNPAEPPASEKAPP